MSEQWTDRLLGDLFTLEYGASLSDAVRRPGQVAVYGSNGCVGFHDISLCSGPGIIVGRKGSVGQVCWSKDDFWPIDTTYYVQPKNNIEFRWLYWLLLQCNLSKLNSSTGVPGLNRNDAYSQVAYAPPLVEQHAIATILDSVDEAIRQTDAVIVKLRQVKAGMLHDLLTCGLDENGELRDPIRHPEQFKGSPIGLIPKGWEIITMVEACSKGGGSIQTGPFGSQLHAEDYVKQGTPIITVEHIGELEIVHKNLPQVCDQDLFRLRKYTLAMNDLVFSRVGAIDRCAMVSKNEDGWLFSGRCLRVRPGKQGINSKYLCYQLNSHRCRTWILNNSVGSTMKCLNTTILGLVPLLLSAKHEQEQIGTILFEFDQQIREGSKDLAKLHVIKQGLMHDLLTGKVRVPKNLLEATS